MTTHALLFLFRFDLFYWDFFLLSYEFKTILLGFVKNFDGDNTTPIDSFW